MIAVKKSILVLLFICLYNTLSACSAFLLSGKNYSVVGFNENWRTSSGIAAINKRGVNKYNLSWNQMASKSPAKEKMLNWTSKYGSVSFSMLGLDLPCYGLNEKGLFIVELALRSTTAVKDTSKANLFWGHWIQYHLDNFASVSEAVNSIKNMPAVESWPKFMGSHYFLCDKSGRTACIEILNGEFKVIYGEQMPVQALCNDEYQKSCQETLQLDFMGGSKPFNIFSKGWEPRFSKAAYYIKSYDPKKSGPAVNYAWNVVDSIMPGQWQVVADLKKGVVFFRTDLGKDIKSLDLSKLDFSLSSPFQYLDINSTLKGDVRKSLSILTINLFGLDFRLTTNIKGLPFRRNLLIFKII